MQQGLLPERAALLSALCVWNLVQFGLQRVSCTAVCIVHNVICFRFLQVSCTAVCIVHNVFCFRFPQVSCTAVCIAGNVLYLKFATFQDKGHLANMVKQGLLPKMSCIAECIVYVVPYHQP